MANNSFVCAKDTINDQINMQLEGYIILFLFQVTMETSTDIGRSL